MYNTRVRNIRVLYGVLTFSDNGAFWRNTRIVYIRPVQQTDIIYALYYTMASPDETTHFRRSK